MISKNEIEAQVALGIVETPQQLAKLVKKTTEVDVLEWAIKHKNTKVRIAAITNPLLPVGLLVRACIFEFTGTTRTALLKTIDTRRRDIDEFLAVVKYYPQLSFDL